MDNLRASLAGKANISNIRILEEALVPGAPSGPNRPRGIILWSMVGFLAGFGLAFFNDQINRKIWVAKDLYPTIPVPFLGYVPMIKELSQNKKHIMRKTLEPVSIVEILSRHTLLADMVAGIRTHILFSMPFEKSKRVRGI